MSLPVCVVNPKHSIDSYFQCGEFEIRLWKSTLARYPRIRKGEGRVILLKLNGTRKERSIRRYHVGKVLNKCSWEKFWQLSAQIHSDNFESEQVKHILLPPETSLLHFQTGPLSSRFVLAKRRSYGRIIDALAFGIYFRESEARMLFRQIASAVCYAHKRGIVLRDVAASMWEFTDLESTKIRLVDFDAMMFCQGTDNRTDRHVRVFYLPPEITYPGSAPYSGKAADMWGLGVLLYCMLYTKYPFYHENFGGLQNAIRAADCPFFTHPIISFELKFLINRLLLEADPHNRITAERLVNHVWLSDAFERRLLFHEP